MLETPPILPFLFLSLHLWLQHHTASPVEEQNYTNPGRLALVRELRTLRRFTEFLINHSKDYIEEVEQELFDLHRGK